jgi:hypothetical protein
MKHNLILRQIEAFRKFQVKASRIKIVVTFRIIALITLLMSAYQNCARETKIEEYTAPSTSGKFSTVNATIEDSLNDPQAILDTISDTSNTAFSCLRSANTPCLNGTQVSLAVNRVYDSFGEILFDDLTNQRQGLNAQNEQCNTYKYLNNIEGTHDPICQTRIEIYWEPSCNNNTLNCDNSNLTHKFKVVYLTSKKAPPKNVLSREEINTPASIMQPTPYSDAKGTGITLLSFNTTTNVKQNTPYYHSCKGNLVLSNGACACASGQIEDLDSPAQLCMAATQSCTGTIANTAVCTKEYQPSTNSYVLNASNSNMFRCQSGYTAYNGQCRDSQTSCSVTNGTCVNNFNASTGGYTQVITCNSGYGKPTANQSLCLPLTWTSQIRDYTNVYCYGDTANHTYTQYYQYSYATNKGNKGLSITSYGSYVYGREGSTANGGFTITCTLK